VKFSVLLPTRNRQEYLRYAIESVLQQDYQNWEIIISDNDSEQDIKGYIASLADPRIKYFRTSTFVPVTDNWNNALEKNTGDYIIMLGDDDCLAKGYFRTTSKLLEQHHYPEMIYNSALVYAYPGIFPEHPEGLLLKWGNASFLEGRKEPFYLDKSEAHIAVRQVLNFRNEFNYNIQFSLFSKEFIKKMQCYGPFFQSPYPDYYATTASLLKAERILAVPFPLVAIGITPKSFGGFYFSGNEKEGVKFLNNTSESEVSRRMKKHLIPGNSMISSWLLAMETVRTNFGKEFDLKVSYNKYRFLQVLDHYYKFALKKGVNTKDLMNLSRYLFWWEKAVYSTPLYLLSLCVRILPTKRKEGWCAQLIQSISHPQFSTKRIEGKFSNILEAVENVNLP